MTARRSRRGFTLIEVLLVIAIIAILAGVLVFFVGGTPEKAKKDATKILIQQVCDALERYKLDIGHYPSVEEGGLAALRKKPTFDDEKMGEKWAGPYLKSDPADPWTTPLGYTLPEPASEEAKTIPYKVWSHGPNKQDDNGAPDDIRNQAWEDAEKEK